MKNTFAEYGYEPEEIENRVNDTFYEIFEGMERFYFNGIGDTGYFMDTGNCDARTEGMSYGMLMSVMMDVDGDKKEYFDRMWKFAMDFMYMDEGFLKGYFAWSVAPDGKKNAFGPAPDGEEFFAMALFLAGRKWGDGQGIYNYTKWAKKILHTCLHHKAAMWDKDSALILFVPACKFSDPSYHLMHFYHYFAMWADECDRPFWKRAEEASRKFLIKTCHPKTGMNPEYAKMDGSPEPYGPPEGHGDFYSDAYRTAANIGLDVLWNGSSNQKYSSEADSNSIPAEHQAFSKIADNLVNFFADIPTEQFAKYKIDGSPVCNEDGSPEKALHPIGLLATLAQASLACSPAAKTSAEKIVKRFWETPLRHGERRYYDNCLYMFAMMALSGKYSV
ncbi:MAG: xylanase [Treponema sp.]|nr:xylanase [Treponema sp.]